MPTKLQVNRPQNEAMAPNLHCWEDETQRKQYDSLQETANNERKRYNKKQRLKINKVNHEEQNKLAGEQELGGQEKGYVNRETDS